MEEQHQAAIIKQADTRARIRQRRDEQSQSTVVMKTTSLLLLAAAPLGASAFSAPSPRLSKPAATKSALLAATPLGGPDSKPPTNPLKDLFSLWNREVTQTLERKEVTVIEPDFKLAWIFGMAALFIWLVYPDRTMCEPGFTEHFCAPTFVGGLGAFIHAWFALFLADRASRCRVIFDDRNGKFEIKNIYKEGSFSYKDRIDTFEERKNYVLGGPSGWKYDKFLNYAFVPSVHVPILVYFKEDQTPPRKWTVGPGKYDPVGKGMVHFFPAFGNSYEIKREFEKRNLNKRKL